MRQCVCACICQKNVYVKEKMCLHAAERCWQLSRKTETNVHFAELGKTLHAVPGKPNHCRELKSLTLFFHSKDSGDVCLRKRRKKSLKKSHCLYIHMYKRRRVSTSFFIDQPSEESGLVRHQ